MSKKMLATMSALVVFGVMGIGAGSAAASAPGEVPASDTGAIVFTGHATLDTPIPPITVPPAPQSGGGFVFDGTTTASLWVSNGNPLTGDGSETGSTTTIHASGSFSNVVCGTGTATGTGTIQTTPAGEGPITVNFTIVFVAGNGTLTITSGSWDDDTTVAGGGVVHLANTPPENCAGPGNTTQFDITGAASVTATGNTD